MSIVFGLIVLVVIALLALSVFCVAKLVYQSYLKRIAVPLTARSSMSPDSELPRRATALVDTLTMRAILIGVLALVMLVPLAFVGEIVYERSNRYGTVLDDIARNWGGHQTLMGPVLLVPFTETHTIQQTLTDSNGISKVIDKVVRTEQVGKFLPDDLVVDVRLVDEVRERGIFKSLVYAAELDVVATIDAKEIASLSTHIESIHWDKAWLSVGLSDTRAIKDVSLFEWNGQSSILSPGTRLPELTSGFHAALPELDAQASNTVKISMNVAGSGSFNFAPFGERTRVSMMSSWPHPSFQGDSLPDQHDITQEGFSADWDIPHLARNYPQAWMDGSEEINVSEFIAGVSMFEPVSLYSQVTRAVKYGILFIGLTFLTLLIVELAIKKRMHIVQYGLIGISLCLFFLVLLSLSEHIAFAKAYISAAALTITMISVYTAAVLSSVARGAGVGVLLISLYSVLYSLLQLEDYALLVGTALLVVVVMVLMVVTRGIRQAVDTGSELEADGVAKPEAS